MGHLRSSDNSNNYFHHWRIRIYVWVCYLKCLDLLSVEIPLLVLFGIFFTMSARRIEIKRHLFVIKIGAWFVFWSLSLDIFSTNWTRKIIRKSSSSSIKRTENVLVSISFAVFYVFVVECKQMSFVCYSQFNSRIIPIKWTVQVKLCVCFFSFQFDKSYGKGSPSTPMHSCPRVLSYDDDHFCVFFSLENKMTSTSNETNTRLLKNIYTC